jgi:putative phosphoesterase
VNLAIISDTHMPRGARRLPPECVKRLVRADLIIHAGDLVSMSVLDELSAFGPKVIAVHGNVDDPEVRRTLPQTAQIDAAGARIAVIHDAGPARGRLRRLRSRFPEADAVVFGHSHIPLHESAESGFQIFNPGSPTERRRAPTRSMGLARVSNRKIAFRLIELG